MIYELESQDPLQLIIGTNLVISKIFLRNHITIIQDLNAYLLSIVSNTMY
jgi:hypothetical protein